MTSPVPRRWSCMHWCVGVEAAGKNWQFNKTGNSTKSGTLAIQQKLAIQQNNKNWQFNEGGNSTKWEIQQNGKFNKKWKFSKTGNSRKFQCVLLAISPHPFYKSGMAVSVHSFFRNLYTCGMYESCHYSFFMNTTVRIM